MDPVERYRDSTTTETLTEGRSKDSRAPSTVHSYQLRHSQPGSTKKINFDHPSDHLESSIPPSQLPVHAAKCYSNVSSDATFGFVRAPENGTQRAQEEESVSDEVIMCVDMRDRATVGCCYYETSTGSLHLAEDIQSGGLDAIDTCK